MEQLVLNKEMDVRGASYLKLFLPLRMGTNLKQFYKNVFIIFNL
jgi:hypothetical protein